MRDQTAGILTRDQARQYYDKFGHKQDQQSFYEDPILEWMFEHGEFSSCERIFEFGCGTGRLADQLLTDHLPQTSEYIGVDISSTMVTLAQAKLATFGDKVQVIETKGTPQIDYPEASFDRFVSTYVFDLLASTDIQMVLQEAHRILKPGGLLLLAGITYGHTFGSQITMTLWQGVNRIWPSLLGGCRPIQVENYLQVDHWQIQKRTRVSVRGIASEGVIAIRQS